MANIRQKSFAAGELGPALYGRDDLAKYAVGLKKCRNFFITRQGVAQTRPGTWAIAPAKTGTGFFNILGGNYLRLIPFVFSDTVSYVLEVGHLYIRFYQTGFQLLTGTYPNQVPYEVATPYTALDLAQLKFAQTGNVMTLTHRNYAPMELTRLGATNWTLTAVNFTRPTTTCSPTVTEPYQVPDATHIAREWAYQVTEIRRDTRGVYYESAPFNVVNATLDDSLVYQASTYYQGDNTRGAGSGTKAVSAGAVDGGVAGTQYRCLISSQGALLNTANWTVDNISHSPPYFQTDTLPATFVIYPDKPLILRIHVTDANSLVITNPSFVAYRVYRGRGGLYGFVGDTKGATFTDVGLTPDYTIIPPLGTNPFKTYDSAGNLLTTENPACCTFFESRRIFAGTTQRPGFLFASASGDYSNFDQRLIQVADEAIQLELASRKFEDIRSLLGMQRLLAFTGSAVWAIGGDGGAITATDLIQARKQAEVGSSWVDPLVVDGVAMFIRAKGTGVRALAYDTLRDTYQGIDVSVLATHLFATHQIVDWCHAEDPHGLVWAVREDGVLLSLTYVRDQDIYAWATHDSPGARFVAVCSVPEGTEDAVYVAVNRGGIVYVEVMSKFSEALPMYAGQVGAGYGGVGYDGTGYANARTSMDGTVVAQWVHQFGGSPYFSSVPVDSNLNGVTFGVVTVNTDGVAPLYLGTAVATAGALQVATPAQTVFYGQGFTAELQGLDLVVQGAEMKSKQKNITRLGFEIVGSRGILVGQDFNHLTEWVERQVQDGFQSLPMLSGFFRVNVQGTWEQAASFAVRHTAPFPSQVLSVEREVEFGQD